MEKAIMIEVMKLLQRKFGFIKEICRITTEIGESVSRDDRISTQMLINMRQEEMEKAEKCDQDLYDLERHLPFKERLAFEELVKGAYTGKDADSFEAKKIKDIRDDIQTLLKRTIEVDRAINRRISGDKSFYQTKPGT